MDEQPILVERRTGYRVITLNRPQRLNAFTEAMHQALRDAIAAAEADETCRALLLTGSGRGFCAGQDLNDRLSRTGETPVLGGALETYYNPLIRKLRGLPFLLHPISPPGLDCMLELNLANVVGFMFETTLAAVRLVYAGVFEQCPRLQMIFPHLGGLAPYLMGRLQWGYERFPACNENLSAPPEAYFKRFYYDTVCRNVPALRMALSMFGAEHVVFGTDIPFREDIDMQLQDLEALGLSNAEQQGIAAGNASRLLGIPLQPVSSL